MNRIANASQERGLRVIERPDRRRLEASIRERADFVARSLRNLGVDDAHVDAAVQKVFLLALREAPGLAAVDDEGSLFRAAARVAAQARKRWPRRATQAHTPRERLDSLLDSLPGDLREVFVLCEIEERDAAWAASVLGHQPAWARTRLRRAHRAYCAKLGVGPHAHSGERLRRSLSGEAALVLEAGRRVAASRRATERSLHAVDALTSSSLWGRITLLVARLSLAVFVALALALALALYFTLS